MTVDFVLRNDSIKEVFFGIAEGTDSGPSVKKMFAVESEIVKALNRHGFETGRREGDILTRALIEMFPSLATKWESFNLVDGQTYHLAGQTYVAVVDTNRPIILLDVNRSQAVEHRFSIEDSTTFIQGRKKGRLAFFRYFAMCASPSGQLFRFTCNISEQGKIDGGVVLDATSHNASDLMTPEQFAAQNEPEPA